MKYPQRGFAITELLVTMVLAGVLIALAVPSFANFVTSSRVMLHIAHS
jgi:prepilin-type N-terminal cleavage/methylation domain-containing protein